MDANLLEVISAQDASYGQNGNFRRPALKGMIVYGRVRCAIQRPNIIPSSIEDGDGYYVIVDVYALRCLEEDYFQEADAYSPQHLYFTKGSLIAYIREPAKWIGKDVRLSGKEYGNAVYGTAIRRQNSPKDTSGITAFVFNSPKRVNGKTVYTLACNKVEELAVGDRDCAGTVLEEFMVKLTSSRNNEIPYSKSLDSIIPYTGVESYTEIPMQVTNQKGTQTSIKQPVPQIKPTAIVRGNGERIDISKIDMKLVYHLEGQPKSELCDSFKADIQRCGDGRNEWISSTMEYIDDILSDDENPIGYFELISNIRSGFINNIAANYMSFVGRSNTKCKDLVSKFVSNCENLSILYATGDKVDERQKAVIRTGCDLLKANVSMDARCLDGDDSEISAIPAIQENSIFALNALSVCTGVRYDSLINCLSYMYKNYECTLNDFVGYLLYTPYFLGLVGTGVDLVDCDAIYYGITCASSDLDRVKEINEELRDYIIMLNTLKSVCDGTNSSCRSYGGPSANTFVPLRLYRSSSMHYDKRAIKNVEAFGYPTGDTYLYAVKLLFKGVTASLGISEKEKKYVLKSDNSWYNEGRLKVLEEIGVVNTLDDFIALESNIEMEYSIYTVFEEMGKKLTGITEEQISSVIADFEGSRGFKLEELQKEGVKLCMKNAGVLSGCAGSGKTTTSDCLTEVLKRCIRGANIIYCTPTGKACRRLAEVVGGTVKTIHSQFRLGLGGSALIPHSYVSDSKDKGTGFGKTIYIMDEMAMCSTELMYNVARNMTADSMIYFLGDVKQLPPVGNGCPFKILMKLLPCVELGVSKRAAAGSLVNYNTTLINFMSDGIPAPLMYDSTTFIGKPCADASIQQSVVQTFAGFIDGSMNGTKYKEDDIQVITGYQKDTKVTSIAKLNPALQSLLRKNSKLLFSREQRNGEAKPYYKGDRIIYVNSNSYDICRYIPDGANAFKAVVTLGIVNGDVGKLVGVLRSDSIQFHDCSVSDYARGSKLRGDMTDEEVNELFARREEREDSIRNDKSYVGKDLYFVVIQLYDTDLHQDVLVFLRARGKELLDGSLVLSGGDLDNMDLAYALTCHKMQGSQSPVVIIPLEKSSYSQFINRNMINTMVTRSQGIVCLIGDIAGDNCALSNGRRCISQSDNHDLLSVLTGDLGWVSNG